MMKARCSIQEFHGATPRFLLVALLAIVWLLAPVTADANRKDRARNKSRRSQQVEVVTQVRDVANFSRVKIKGIADVEISFGPEFKVEVEADEEVIDYLETNVSGRTLIVGLEDYDWDFRNLNWDSDDDYPLLVRITMPTLNRLDVKGIGSVLVHGFDGDELEVTVKGIGDVEVREFKGTLLELDLKGVADVEVSGEVDELDVRLSGVGEADLRKLIAKVVYATASGMGDVIVHATERLDATASGFGDVIYYGNPEKVKRDERGFGDVIAKR
jgi:Putative auto-transporter adhesin, head GIN domain